MMEFMYLLSGDFSIWPWQPPLSTPCVLYARGGKVKSLHFPTVLQVWMIYRHRQYASLSSFWTMQRFLTSVCLTYTLVASSQEQNIDIGTQPAFVLFCIAPLIVRNSGIITDPEPATPPMVPTVNHDSDTVVPQSSLEPVLYLYIHTWTCDCQNWENYPVSFALC